MSETNITPFDAAEYLDSEEAIAAYLNDAFESKNDDVMIAALRDVAKARGMTRVAADAGVQRESLYKSLADGAKPRFDTIVKLVGALGVKFVIATDPVVMSHQVEHALPAKRAPRAAKPSGGRRTGKTTATSKSARTQKTAHA
jgi:probable addiction module antidote protein